MSELAGRRPSGPIARHTKLRSHGLVRWALGGVAFLVSALLVAAIGVAAYAYDDYFGALQDNSVAIGDQDMNPPDVEVLSDRAYNLLIAGVDKCEVDWVDQFAGRCSMEEALAQKDTYASQLNDVNMVVHISPEPRSVTVISIPRDMMTSRPECSDIDGNLTAPATAAQFNEAYSLGGLDCVARTATELTGLEIDHAALMTWGGVIDITNAIGGVTVCVEQDIPFDDQTNFELSAGEHDLVGMQALQFLRTRYTLPGGGSALNSIGNQQLYMGALVRKMVSEETFGDVGRLLKLANAITENATLSTGLTDNPMTLVSLASALRGIPLEDYAFIQFPAMDYAPDPNRVAPIPEAWDLIYQALERNQPLDLGDDVEPTETPGPVETPSPTETPDPEKIPLPEYLRGSNADQGGAACAPDAGLF